MVAAIREVDADTPILLDGWFYGSPEGFAYNQPLDDPKTLYAFHNLGPWEFTTYRINRDRYAYPGRMPSQHREARMSRRSSPAATIRSGTCSG